MLVHKLLGTSGSFSYVGGATATGANNASQSISLTSLTGGIDTRPRVGDLLIACIAFRDGTDRNIISVDTTELFDLYANSTNDSQLFVGWKVCTTEQATANFNIVATTVDAVMAVHVWRGNDVGASPISNSATLNNSAVPNPPAVTTTAPDSLVIVIGSAAGATGDLSALTAPTNVTSNLVTVRNANTNIAIGIASTFVSAVGSFDPNAFGGGSALTANSSCAATLAFVAS